MIEDKIKANIWRLFGETYTCAGGVNFCNSLEKSGGD